MNRPRVATAAVFAALIACGDIELAAQGLAQLATPDGLRADGAASGQRAVQPVDARYTTCRDLKARVQEAGSLAIATGPGPGDRFHHRVPQCTVWERSQFLFVVAQDGWCGVGYVCAAKVQP